MSHCPGSSPPSLEASKPGVRGRGAGRWIHVLVCARVCVSAGVCTAHVLGCVSRRHRPHAQRAPPPVQLLLTSRKQSCSSENSGSLSATVEMISSRVCVGATQRVCVSLLNSGCDRREAGCLVTPCRGRPASRRHTHRDTHTAQHRGKGDSRTPREPGQSSGALFTDRKWRQGPGTLPPRPASCSPGARPAICLP